MELLVNAGAIALQDLRKKNGIGKSVRNVVLSAQGMGNCVHIADIRSGKGKSGEVGSVQHLLAGCMVMTIVIGRFNILIDCFYC